MPIVLLFLVDISFYYICYNRPLNYELLQNVVRYPIKMHDLWISAAIAFWAFQGWENLSFMLGEYQNPSANLSKIYWLSYLIILVAYFPFIWSISLAAYSGFTVLGVNGLAGLFGSGLIKKALLFIWQEEILSP